MRLILRLFLIIISSFLLSQTSLAQLPRSDSFKNWEVNCDKYNVCIASTISGSRDSILVDYIFSLKRAEFQEFWEISFSDNKTEPYKSNSIKFNTENKEIEFFSPQEFAAYGNLNQYYFLGKKAQILFDEILPANKMKISFADIEVEFSLSGLSASLLYIDEKQDRVGSAKNAGEPPRYEVIVSSRQPDPIPQMILNEHENPTISGCEPIGELVHGDDLGAFKLNATSTLYLVPCSAGAYNFGYIAYIKNQYETSMLSFASYYAENGWSGTQYLINPYFDEKTQILGDFYKGRGIGDCGTTGVWQWNVYSFKLLEYRAKSECGGEVNENEEIGNFPIIYKDPNYKGFEED